MKHFLQQKNLGNLGGQKNLGVSLLLSSDLLVSRISRGNIKPEYATFSLANLELAALLIKTFKQHVGKPYGNLLSELEGYEEMNYRFIRGLSQLLERRTVIETVAAVDPTSARITAFEACGGLALSEKDRKETMKKAAEKLSVSVIELENALWADLEENQVLKSFEPISQLELLQKYNISLTQTLLFRAVDLDIWVRGNYQKLFRTILSLGLMYTIEETGEAEKKGDEYNKNMPFKETVHLHLNGPASLFSMSERYGNSFARLFPLLLKSKSWKLRAGILYKGFQGKRILEFSLDDSKEVFGPFSVKEIFSEEDSPSARLINSAGLAKEEKEEYKTKTEFLSGKGKKAKAQGDIGLEEENIYDSSFEQEFASLNFGKWEINREPTVLKAGKYAFIPDFSLQRDGIKVYVEIVGFWTPEYLEKKIQKIKEVQEPVILLINRKLRCSEKDFPRRDVIFFEKKIPVYEFMQILRRYEDEKRLKDKEKLQDIKGEISISGDLVNLEVLAKKIGIWPEVLKEFFSKEFLSEKISNLGSSKDYVLLENYAVHRSFLEKIDMALERLGTFGTYSGAVKVFEEFGLDRSLYYPLLGQLGYKVSWCGLSEEEARVKKIKGNYSGYIYWRSF
jgi:predicted nuclease of restriction endonuclease-like RecB superfamily